MRAGKHVLCEKPVAGNATDAKRMFETAIETGKRLMEAFHWRFHPFARRMIAEVGRLSRPLAIEAEFSIPQVPKTDIRYQWALGGGALMDLGCYAVHWVRTLLGEPDSVDAEMVSTVAGVDETTTGVMRYTDGSTATIRTSMSAQEKTCVLRAQAADGWVRADNPLAPQTGNLLSWSNDEISGEEEVAGPTTFEAQLKSFVEMVEDDGPQVVTPQDSIANMTVIDAMYRSGGLEPRP
jgi:predicted dehydrogenase